MILYFLNKDYDALLLQLLLVFVCWMIVLLATGIDLRSGIRKSKERGVFKTHSYGLRMTSKKVVDYFEFMLFMLFLDFLNPLFVYFDIVSLPLLTTLGAIFLVYTEWKSVREKADEKFRHALRNNPNEIIQFIKENRELIEDLKKGKE